MRIGSLFSGAGGLDMAVENVFGATTAWHCELDQAASNVLAARWPGVPNVGDIKQANWATVEPVDILCGGWPCQPWSSAGKRKGTEDERALWPEVARAVRELRPRYVVLENVSAVVVLGELARAVGDLHAAGYDSQWVSVRASDVGAAHRRDRLFILASDTDGRRFPQQQELDRQPKQPQVKASQRRDAGRRSDGAVDLFPTPKASDGEWATPRTSGRPIDKSTHLGTIVSLLPTPRASRGAATTETAYALGGSRSDDGDLQGNVILNEIAWGKYEAAITRWESLTRPAPSPTQPNSAGKPRLSPAFSEWLMGWTAGWVTDIDINRSDQLKIIGNGVVPQQATAALTWLLEMEMAA